MAGMEKAWRTRASWDGPLEARVGAIRTTAPVDGGSKRGRRQPAAQGAGERAAKIGGEGLSVVLLPASTVPIWRDGLGRFGDHTTFQGRMREGLKAWCVSKTPW